jgi:hypothetical protein
LGENEKPAKPESAEIRAEFREFYVKPGRSSVIGEREPNNSEESSCVNQKCAFGRSAAKSAAT